MSNHVPEHQKQGTPVSGVVKSINGFRPITRVAGYVDGIYGSAETYTLAPSTKRKAEGHSPPGFESNSF